MEISARDKIIFPLDFNSEKEAIKYAKLLAEHVGIFKIGLELFISCGPQIIKAVRIASGGRKIFLDLKLHDIPETVARAVSAASELDVDFITFHPEDDLKITERIQERNISNLILLAVTVLTSGKAGKNHNNLTDTVLKKAEQGLKAGAKGIVCSPLEVKEVKKNFPELLVITPGIRPQWSVVANDDQKRFTTPEEAVINGADFIVVGRPIKNADNPKKAAEMVKKEIEKAIEKYGIIT